MNTGIYNNLLSTYSPKPLTKYDTHKASELRSIVAKIARITSASPIYLLNLTDAKQTYALGVKESAMLIHIGFEELSDDSSDGVFARRKAYSSAKGSVDSEITGDNYSKLPEEFDIKVNHLATSQVNKGYTFSSKGTSLDAGTYKFRVSVSDDIYDFQYNVKNNSTNIEVMSGLSSFINKANIGLKASYEFEDESGKKAYMKIESELTGSAAGERIFTLDDQSKGKNKGIVEYLGLDEMSLAPTSSEFYIDGEERHTLSNDFTISKVLQVSLKNVSSDPVHISYMPDAEGILGGVQKIADAYNYMFESTEVYRKASKGNLKLVAEMRNIIEPYIPDLESCGISFDDAGKMQVDEALAIQAVNDGDMQKMFGADSEFTKIMMKKTDEVKLNPMEYVDKVTVSYPNYTKSAQGYSYITSLYSGMLFNYYC